jgi:hypothetical protein
MAAAVAFISNATQIESSATERQFLLITLCSDPAFTGIRKIWQEPLVSVECPFLNIPQIGKVSTMSYRAFRIACVILPFLTQKGRTVSLPADSCLYETQLPEKVFSRDNFDGIVQGIRRLSERIQKAQKELQIEDETSLDIVRQKVLIDSRKLECQIDLHKEMLEGELNDQKGVLLDQVRQTIASGFVLDKSVDFHGNYSLSGAEAARQLMSVVFQ